jgi:(p)ppGpp synthase/HD superfamily hydrolase
MPLSERFCEALAYAARLHARQQRKVFHQPYVGHVMAVSAVVLHYGGSEDEAIAALLHDAAEDQGGAATLAEIGERFGAEVARIVAGCSDTLVSPKPPWRERKERHVAKMRQADDSIRLVAAADKLDNARTLVDEYRRCGERLWENFRGGRAGTLWYYRAMIDALAHPAAAAQVLRLLEEVARVVGQLEQLAGPSAGTAVNEPTA